jgi:hypothetical protein
MTRPRLSERDFQKAVVELAQLRRWRVAHFHRVHVQRKDGSHAWMTPVAADGKGFPDLVLVRDRVVYAELKRRGGVASAEQHHWADALKAAGQEVHQWDPGDWEEIVAVLS